MATETKQIYQAIAQAAKWEHDTGNACNVKWHGVAGSVLETLQGMLPSGSGIDCGTKIYTGKNGGFILIVEFHHMDDSGYTEWTTHNIQVRPCLIDGFTLKISGKDRNDIKDYLYEVYDCALRETVDYRAIVTEAT